MTDIYLDAIANAGTTDAEQQLEAELYASKLFAQPEFQRLFKNASEEDRRFLEITRMGIQYALLTIKERFEGNKSSIEYRPFHNTDHTKGVIERTIAILLQLQKHGGMIGKTITLHSILRATLEAAFHDIVQNYQSPQETTLLYREEGEDKSIPVMGKKRVRSPVDKSKRTATNEYQSAEELIAFLEKSSIELNEEDKEQYRQDIETTIPQFIPEKGVIQPNFTKDSSIAAKALALADLGVVGMIKEDNSSQAFNVYVKDSDANFREDNIDIYEDVYSKKFISATKAKDLIDRIVQWTANETNFIRTRNERYIEELAYFNDTKDQEAISNLFVNFSDSATFSDSPTSKRIANLHEHAKAHRTQRTKRLTQGQLRSVLTEMGYDMDEVVIEMELQQVLSSENNNNRS